jgi:hypothetical protein
MQQALGSWSHFFIKYIFIYFSLMTYLFLGATLVSDPGYLPDHLKVSEPFVYTYSFSI